MQDKLKVPKLQPEVIYKIIELDPSVSAADWGKEDEEALRTLKGQPGYNSLLKKIRIQKSFIDNALRAQRFESLADFTATQSWSQCLRWLETLIKEQVEKTEPKARSAFAVEEEAFESIQKALKIVGAKD